MRSSNDVIAFEGGRVVMTVSTVPSARGSITAVVARGDTQVLLTSATVWGVGTIWTTQEAVLNTPRPRRGFG